MTPQENCHIHYQDDNACNIGQEQAQWEAMEHSEKATPLLLSRERTAGRRPAELEHDHAGRRTLDESRADEDQDDQH